jgi:hypothetical protein
MVAMMGTMRSNSDFALNRWAVNTEQWNGLRKVYAFRCLPALPCHLLSDPGLTVPFQGSPLRANTIRP